MRMDAQQLLCRKLQATKTSSFGRRWQVGHAAASSVGGSNSVSSEYPGKSEAHHSIRFDLPESLPLKFMPFRHCKP